MGKVFFGTVKPEGNLRKSIQKDMEGCIGNLDKLAPENIVVQEIYGRDRLSKDSKQAELGRKPDEHSHIEFDFNDDQFMWWNSESQSNWRDGYCRGALLLEDKDLCNKVDEYINEILNTQDEDGYLGIYGSDLRYKHEVENGELWAQSSLFRVLLGYYEKTGDERVKKALVDAIDNLMAGYPIYKSDPFKVKGSFSGHCHGLTIMDSLNEMYEITLDKKYLDYAVWLYENYSSNDVSEEDMKIDSINNPQYIWKNHGVHVYEHIRAVIIAAYHKPEHKHLLDKVLAKLPFYLTPSGGPMGDEWLFSRTANATSTGYEFCSVLELFDSYQLLLEKSKDISIGDSMEWLYFNAGLGMKHPTESSIMYCKSDNCYTANRKLNTTDVFIDERYKYSPVHQTTAVCCVPNMGRLNPHYVQSMYLKEDNGFSAVLFGASVLEDKFNDTKISIRQITDYPANNIIKFEIDTEKPVKFAFGIRKPKWATNVIVNWDYTSCENKIVIDKQWNGKEVVTVEFECGVKLNSDLVKDWFISYGPLVYALPIYSKEETILNYDIKPFREVGYEAKDYTIETLKIHEDDRDKFVYHSGTNDNYMTQKIVGTFWNGENSKEYSMVPMGGTILRKITFNIGLGGKK